MPKSISETARLSGCSTATIRFYESIGLIPPAARTSGGQRTFGWPDASRLQFIRRARDFGLSIEQLRELLRLPPTDSAGCSTARQIIQQRLDEIREKQTELIRLENSLVRMARRCDQTCGPSAAQPCTIFEDLRTAAR
jgi:MerR family transcriptional regulator, copper efflux regulator